MKRVVLILKQKGLFVLFIPLKVGKLEHPTIFMNHCSSKLFYVTKGEYESITKRTYAIVYQNANDFEILSERFEEEGSYLFHDHGQILAKIIDQCVNEKLNDLPK